MQLTERSLEYIKSELESLAEGRIVIQIIQNKPLDIATTSVRGKDFSMNGKRVIDKTLMTDIQSEVESIRYGKVSLCVECESNEIQIIRETRRRFPDPQLDKIEESEKVFRKG